MTGLRSIVLLFVAFLRCQGDAPPGELVAGLIVFALERRRRFVLGLLVPLAERVAVPRRLRPERREVQLLLPYLLRAPPIFLRPPPPPRERVLPPPGHHHHRGFPPALPRPFPLISQFPPRPGR